MKAIIQLRVNTCINVFLFFQQGGKGKGIIIKLLI